MRKQILLFLIGILLFTGIVSATTQYTTVNEIKYWTSDPCIGQGIQVGEKINFKIYPIICTFKDSGFYSLLSGTCDDVSIRVILDTPTVQDSGWVNLYAPIYCHNNVNCPTTLTNHPNNFFYLPQDESTTAYDKYGKFAIILPSTIRVNFAYHTPFNSTNQTVNGFGNFSFDLDDVGDYTLRIQMKDIDNGSMAVNTKLLNFSVVANNGVIGGQCNSTSADSSNIQPTSNFFTNIFGSWMHGKFQSIAWFVLMLVLAGFLLFISRGNVKAGIGITAFAELIMLFMGAWLHIISPIWLLLFGVAICLIIALFVKKVFT